MVNKNEIMELLKKYFKTTGVITIDDEGLVSCTGDVGLQPELKHERLPVSFDKVGGKVHCSNNQLTTLQGAPKKVGGLFWCHNNQLTTLEGAPTSVGGDFWCYHNQLTSLQGGPNNVGGSFWCHYNQLTTLEGLPVVRKLFLSYSPTLPLLRCLLAKQVEFHPELENKTIENILNKYAGQGKRALFDCQKELEDAGFERNARW